MKWQVKTTSKVARDRGEAYIHIYIYIYVYICTYICMCIYSERINHAHT